MDVQSLLRRVVRCKPVTGFFEPEEREREPLARSFGLFQLTMLGVGGTIGTGIFIALTTAVPEAGPAVTISFVIAGITAALTALCYAELASVVPAAGSSYAYAYPCRRSAEHRPEQGSTHRLPRLVRCLAPSR